ncbi:MAG: 23S rRNA (pseudouridine1915-N3)-methyltransferase [Candidatus Electronema aureum]|uniref:Ribosomal RNA large subunit methyltransferase H n=1 Tax=Candidatus Electronema aureum TaxID=2005002 RepID=A0A521G188_9BACT|nr:MAG: 23S rRNA (pseudouridine1915-N3)-methyltransferase [Candidatus Electronema aureum]
MRFILPFLGKTKESYLDHGIRDYAERLRRYVPVDIKVLKEPGKNEPDAVLMAREADLLLSQAAAASLLVALDPAGREQTSEDMAAALESWESRGLHTICFLIGGHLGLDPRVRQQANALWSLSRLTFTHEMSRFILIEQLYRACSIKAGHKYHR